LNGLTPSDCIAIEDTQVGIEAAKEAGLTAVAHPNNTTKNLDFSRADYVIHDPKDLLSILKLQ
jgi:beta-phosphoglucomutase-like phosphatase (HAD superfamily)